MKKIYKYLLIIMLVLAQIVPHHIEDTSAAATKTIEQQVRDYAKSINKSNADDDAALALAMHGITGRGKQLTVGANHALTATIANSKMFLALASEALEKAIHYMDLTGYDSLFIDGGCNWNGTNQYYSFGFFPVNSSNEISHRIYQSNIIYYNEKNDYDKSLEWLSASTETHMYISKKQVNKDDIVYQVKFEFTDDFNFRGDNGSVPKNIASLLGSVLFKEFNWVATASFSLTASNTCDHKTGNYHFAYDEVTSQMESHENDSFVKNDATQKNYSTLTNTMTYYELDRTINLCHDKPWEMEYTMKSPTKIAFSLSEFKNTVYPYFLSYQKTFIAFKIYKDGMDQYIGTRVSFTYNDEDIYRISLKNVIDKNKNMIYVSVYNESTDTLLMDSVEMNDCFVIENQSWDKVDDNDHSLSGLDIKFHLIGNKSYTFKQSHFELKVWEEGKGNKNISTFTKKTLSPTCTSDGYYEYTCKLCSYKYKEKYTNKLGHSAIVDKGIEASCTQTGLTQGSHCDRCKSVIVKQETIEALGHNYVSDVTDVTCTTDGYTTHTCLRCEDNYVSDEIKASGHIFTNYISDNNATIEANGTKTSKCDHCDVKDTIIDEGTQLNKVKSDIYKIDDKYIYNIPLSMNANTLKDNFYFKDYIHVSNETVGTGTKVNIVVDGVIGDSKEVIVSGDVNGDGKITITDMIAIKAQLLNKNKLEGAYALAADMNSDSKISITDFIQSKAYILKK